MELKYIQKTRNGLTNNHKYVVKVFSPKNKLYVYTVQFLFDITEQEEMDLVLEYASQISLKHNFQFNSLELED